MRGSVREILSATVLLVAAYLVLVHFTGFATDVKAVGSTYQGAVSTLQGR